MQGNTLLITGGGSGIGRGLAVAFAQLGNHVVVAGRRLQALQETAALAPNIAYMQLDVGEAEAIEPFAKRLLATHPQLNVVVHNAGIMRAEDLADAQGSLRTAEATVATNLLGPIRLNAALLPHLRQKAHATVITVSSGLAFLPLAMTPSYCATKAAIHSYTQSLRWQLRDTPVEVLEIIPPYVQTELMDGKNDPMAMPLDAFLRETMQAFDHVPPSGEVRVRRVDTLRLAEREGRYDETYAQYNALRAAKTAP